MNPAIFHALAKGFGELIKQAGRSNQTQKLLIAQAQAALLMATGAATVLATLVVKKHLDSNNDQSSLFIE